MRPSEDGASNASRLVCLCGTFAALAIERANREQRLACPSAQETSTAAAAQGMAQQLRKPCKMCSIAAASRAFAFRIINANYRLADVGCGNGVLEDGMTRRSVGFAVT
jgi:hypothetical protein